jgi:hypothetical protein
MGKYHGEWGFRTYTNARGVLYHGTEIDPDLRYPPYSRRMALRDRVASSTSAASTPREAPSRSL